MRTMGTCRADGYRMLDAATFGDPEASLCSNPWHPRHSGACPKCGSRAGHTLAGMGMAEAMCAACGHLWVPSVPLG